VPQVCVLMALETVLVQVGLVRHPMTVLVGDR